MRLQKEMPSMKTFMAIWFVWAVVCLSLLGLGVWAIAHFVAKFW